MHFNKLVRAQLCFCISHVCRDRVRKAAVLVTQTLSGSEQLCQSNLYTLIHIHTVEFSHSEYGANTYEVVNQVQVSYTS